jgi:hypothetical protein
MMEPSCFGRDDGVSDGLLGGGALEFAGGFGEDVVVGEGVGVLEGFGEDACDAGG